MRQYHQLRPEEKQNACLQQKCMWFLSITAFLIGCILMLIRTFFYTELDDYQLSVTLKVGFFLVLGGFGMMCMLRHNIVVRNRYRRLSTISQDTDDIEDQDFDVPTETEHMVSRSSGGLYSLPNREQQLMSLPRRGTRRSRRLRSR